VVGVFLETGEGHPDLQHPFFHEVLVGLKDRLGAGGYDLLLFASAKPGNGFGPRSYLKRCWHHRVDGAVLMGVDGTDPEVLRLAEADLPLVAVDIELGGARTACVSSDNVRGTRDAVAHLLALGHTRIATIAGPLDTRPGRDRLQGFTETMAAAGGADPDLVAHGDFYVDSGYEAARRLLSLPEPPTAIVAASDLMAVGVYRAALAHGLDVPRDLSVVGFDDITVAAYLQPGLTTMRQDKVGLGAAAARVLMREADGTDDTGFTASLPLELVVRASTAPPPP
jgi:LacI family transcriptional regulator